jgi:hypothetical protein
MSETPGEPPTKPRKQRFNDQTWTCDNWPRSVPAGEIPICCPEKPKLQPRDRWAGGWRAGDLECGGCGGVWRPPDVG